MSNSEREWYANHMKECVIQELSLIEHEDPAQRLFLFLMYNDQRRHLDDFYEEQHKHRLSYHLPFFDSDLLQCVFQLPLEYRLCHRFYSDWFNLFDESLRSVPWQTYPDHVPCPFPIDSSLSYQWDQSERSTINSDRLVVAKRGIRQTFSGETVKPMSRLRLFVCSLLHATGGQDYEHVIDSCDKFQRYEKFTRK